MKSFSATDYKGAEVKGTIIYKDEAQSFCLVDEDCFPNDRTLWLIDKLDDVGVSLDAEQVRELLPRLQRWANPITQDSTSASELAAPEPSLLRKVLIQARQLIAENDYSVRDVIYTASPNAGGLIYAVDTKENVLALIDKVIATTPTPIHEGGEQLKPCGCGRPAKIEEFFIDDDPTKWYVATCSICPIKTYDQFTVEEAARIWNVCMSTRAATPVVEENQNEQS